jgi:RNA polymerase sigma-70 factor (ECF subfamily)
MDESALGNRLDPQAVTVVFDRYYPEVFRFVRYRLADGFLAEDIASEVFVRLLEAIRAGRGPERNIRAWLFSTANHLVNDQMRIRYRRKGQRLKDSHPAEGPQMDEDIQSSEERRSLAAGLLTLTMEQQNVLALRFGAGYSLEETSTIMKKNVNSIKQLQFRALAALQRTLGVER